MRTSFFGPRRPNSGCRGSVSLSCANRSPSPAAIHFNPGGDLRRRSDSVRSVRKPITSCPVRIQSRPSRSRPVPGKPTTEIGDEFVEICSIKQRVPRVPSRPRRPMRPVDFAVSPRVFSQSRPRVSFRRPVPGEGSPDRPCRRRVCRICRDSLDKTACPVPTSTGRPRLVGDRVLPYAKTDRHQQQSPHRPGSLPAYPSESVPSMTST